MGNDYALFKEGIKPIWEDPRNHKGGRWLVTLDMRHKSNLPELWLNLVNYHSFCMTLMSIDVEKSFQYYGDYL